MSKTRQQRRKGITKKNATKSKEEIVGKYDPNGDQKLFVAVHLDITTEKFLKARAKNEEEGRQVDFLFKIDGVETEVTYEELCEFLQSKHVEE